MKIKNIVFASLLLFSFSCQTPGYFQTAESVPPSDELNETLLKDVVVSVQNNFLPAKTRLYFPHNGEKLAVALEASLRRHGYALSLDSKNREKNDLQFAYKFSEVEPGIFVLRVVIGEGFQINRLYQQTKDGEYLAAGPILMRRG